MSKIEQYIKDEENLIDKKINLIASENLPSKRIFNVLGSILSQRYSEGYPRKRYYGGNEIIDLVENEAIENAKKLFNCNFANVQPHSGSQANMAAIMAFCKPGDTILGMELNAGGHLTHGAPFSFSGKFFNAVHYGVDENGYLNYDELKEKLYSEKPRLLIVGASAYSRIIDFKKIRDIVDTYNRSLFSESLLSDVINTWNNVSLSDFDILKEKQCYLMVDMAHIAGLVATGLHPSPIPYADVVTSTTHKTLRGPRGGIILWNNEEYTKKINSALFPGVQGGPNNALTAAKSICFEEAMTDEFKTYINNVLLNMQALIKGLKEESIEILTDGSDNHQCLVKLSNLGIDGNTAQELLEKEGIITNKNFIPGDTKKATGLRLGTALITTQGYTETQCYELGKKIGNILKKK